MWLIKPSSCLRGEGGVKVGMVGYYDANGDGEEKDAVVLLNSIMMGGRRIPTTLDGNWSTSPLKGLYVNFTNYDIILAQ